MWSFETNPGGPSGESSGDDSQQVLSVLDPAEVEAIGGLPPEAIAGILRPAPGFVTGKSPPEPTADPTQAAPDNRSSASGFRPNSKFSAFMHHVIRTHGPQDRDLQQAAERQKDGYLYVIDFRTPDGIMGRVPPEDIVGAFAVKDGRIGAYEPNANHRLFTENGLVQLPPSLARAHINELKRLKVQ